MRPINIERLRWMPSLIGKQEKCIGNMRITQLDYIEKNLTQTFSQR